MSDDNDNNKLMVFDTPDGIAYYQLCAIKARLKLEMLGMKSRRSAWKAAKQLYGLKGSREKVLKQLEAMIAEAVQKKRMEKGVVCG